MDRSKHQIVKFGGVVRYPLQPKFEELELSVNKLATAPAVAVKPDPIQEVVENAEGEKETIVIEQPMPEVDEYIISPDLLMDPSLDTAVTTSRVCKLDHMRKHPEDKVFRSFNISCELLTSNSVIEDHVAALRFCKNFGSLTSTIKKIANYQYETAQEKQDVLLVLAEIDRKLTEKTNEFLNYKLGIPATIDEFSTDVMDLKRWLLDKYKNAAYGEAFDRFEGELMSSINNELDEQEFQDMKDRYGISSEVYASYLPFMYSFTHINLTDEELGFDAKDFRDTTVQISREQQESLYNLIHTLDLNKFAKKLATVTDYLITSDGVKYRVFINYINPEVLTIAREIDG